MKEKESDIQRAICDYLALKKWFFWRANTMPVFSEGKYRAMPKYAKTGVPDIICVVNYQELGILIGFEVKTKSGRQSESQKTFEDDFTEAGAFYFLVTDIYEVESAILNAKEETMRRMQNFIRS